MPGARPQYLWDFVPSFKKFEKIVLFVCDIASEDFQSKSGTFCEAKELVQVASEILELARILILRTSFVSFVGVPPRGTEGLQKRS